MKGEAKRDSARLRIAPGRPGDDGGDDHDLVRRCLRRPPLQGAWEELYRRYAPVIRWRIARGRRVFPDSLVEDAVQEVFLKLARGALAAFRGRCGLPRYLVMIADSVRISENRRWLSGKRAIWREVADGGEALSRIPAPGEPPTAGARPSHLLSPEERLLRLEGEARFRHLLDRLPDPRDREILRLYFGSDPLTDREIGERMRMPTNTVTWRRHTALRFLRGAGDRGAVS